MKTFLQKNKSTLLLLFAFGLGWLIMLLLRSDKTDELYKSPTKGQVYILQSQNEFAPMLLDSLSADVFYFFDYEYVFKGDIPKVSQIKQDEFNRSFYAIYKKTELDRLFNQGKIVKIYSGLDK